MVWQREDGRQLVIQIVCSARNRYPIQRLIDTSAELGRRISILSYDLLFARARIAPTTCVFTDFDLLSTYEVDAAARAAQAVETAGQQVLNKPHLAAERYELMHRLRRQGLNPTEVNRLDDATL